MNRMSEITIVRTERAHVIELGPKLRAADCGELQAAGLTAGKALWRSWRRSLFAKTAFVDGEIAAIWGMGGSPFSAVGRPWLLTAAPVEKVPKAFLQTARQEVRFMLSICPRLLGIVDGRYHRALRLLEMVGFDLSNEFPYGPHEMMFRQYEMRR